MRVRQYLHRAKKSWRYRLWGNKRTNESASVFSGATIENVAFDFRSILASDQYIAAIVECLFQSGAKLLSRCELRDPALKFSWDVPETTSSESGSALENSADLLENRCCSNPCFLRDVILNLNQRIEGMNGAYRFIEQISGGRISVTIEIIARAVPHKPRSEPKVSFTAEAS